MDATELQLRRMIAILSDKISDLTERVEKLEIELEELKKKD